jgi:hypothetical protein
LPPMPDSVMAAMPGMPSTAAPSARPTAKPPE